MSQTISDHNDTELVGTIEIKRRKLAQLLLELKNVRSRCTRLHCENESLAAEISLQRLKLESYQERLTPSLEKAITWEDRKAMIWQQLEDDEDCDPDQKKQFIDIVQETERIVADRDQEIAELRLLMSQQREIPTTVDDQQVTGATAIASILDADEMIAMERHNLEKLKQEWMEKLQQAEIDMSIERAAIARQQHDLQEEIDYHRRVKTTY